MEFSFILSAAADVAADVAATGEPRMFGLDAQLFWQVGAQLFNLLLLCFLLTKLLYKPVQKAMAKRTERVQTQLEEAEADRDEAAKLKLEYEQKMEAVSRERDEILAEARKLATETSSRLIGDAKKEAESIRERAAASVALEWERAEDGMRTAIIDVSAVMAEKFVSLAINKETHDRLFDDTMSDLEGMTWRN